MVFPMANDLGVMILTRAGSEAFFYRWGSTILVYAFVQLEANSVRFQNAEHTTLPLRFRRNTRRNSSLASASKFS